jgi:CheY-like chemotaxis protein
VELTMELDDTLPRTQADPDQVQQLLVNLITNSVQAMADTAAPRRMIIITRLLKNSIQIAVEDNGPGVPAELETKIFEPFFTTKKVGTGTGLGLSIAHSMMTEHKGRIFYQKSSLGGAGFVLEFPILAAGASTAPVKEPVKPEEVIAPVPSIPVCHILVLDDERALAEMIAEVLDILGHSTKVCHTAEHALELIEKERFDIIFSDYRMPDINGQQFYEFVKQGHPDLATRIIFVTGDLVNEETRSFLSTTNNPHLEKPFNLTSIAKVLAEVLKTKDQEAPANQGTAAR